MEEKVDAQAEMSISALVMCIRCGTQMVEGVKYGYAAWVCPDCGYWKLKTS